MKCKNCEQPILKSAPFCSNCGAKNEGHLTTEERLDRQEKEIEELKKVKPAAETPAAGDESLIG